MGWSMLAAAMAPLLQMMRVELHMRSGLRDVHYRCRDPVVLEDDMLTSKKLLCSITGRTYVRFRHDILMRG